MASSATGLNGLTDSVRRNGKIEWLHFRHEEVVACLPLEQTRILPASSRFVPEPADQAISTSSMAA
jgi:hypothetical protein